MKEWLCALVRLYMHQLQSFQVPLQIVWSSRWLLLKTVSKHSWRLKYKIMCYVGFIINMFIHLVACTFAFLSYVCAYINNILIIKGKVCETNISQNNLLFVWVMTPILFFFFCFTSCFYPMLATPHNLISGILMWHS